ncbi:MAG: 5'/3'-nucleotidase SurE [Candidatus Aminicenantia bacterium]
MKKILLTNDDGFHSEGLAALEKSLKELGEVIVVAPDKERSAVSFSLTLHRPLRVTQLRENFFIVDGTPADCVNITLKDLINEMPQLVVSGINLGPNLGDDTIFSGTVSAAIQAMLFDIPSFAISAISKDGNFYLEDSAKIATLIAKWVMEKGLPKGVVLSVNVPPPPVRGVKITELGRKRYFPDVIEMVDPRGRKYFWIGNGNPVLEGSENTDVWAIKENFVSITPIHIDLTARAYLKKLRDSDLSKFIQESIDEIFKKTL